MSRNHFGIFCAVMTILGWAIHDTVIRYAVTSLSANPILFTGLAQIGGAIVLLIIAGPGRLATETLKSSHTWIHGLLHILTTIFYSMGLVYISATEGNILGRLDILLAIVLTWLFFSRRPHLTDILGSIPIVIGLILVTVNMPSDIRIVAFVLLFIHSLFATLRAMCGEVHPTNNKASSIKERCRVSGLVLLMMGLSFSIMTIFASYMKDGLGLQADFFLMVPSLEDLLNKGTVVSGLFMGGVTLSFAMFFYFYSVSIIKTELFLMVGVLLPFFTFASEWVASSFGWVDVSHINLIDLFASVLIAAGAFYMVYMRQKKDLGLELPSD